jgi:hypothetical protein
MSHPTQSRLGEPIELPWWVPALAVPPLLVALAGLVIPATLPARVLAVAPALLLIWLIARVARRVRSQSMQSVWISAAFGVWAVFPAAWIVLVLTGGR